MKKGFDRRRLAAVLQIGDVILRFDFRVPKMDHPQIGMGDELEISHHADPDSALDRFPDGFAAADFPDHVDVHGCTFQRLLKGKPGCRALLAQDEFLAGQIAKTNCFSCEPGVIPVHENHHFVTRIGFLLNARVVLEMRENRDIRFEFKQTLQGLPGISKKHRKLYGRIEPVEGADHLGCVKRPDGGEPEVPSLQFAMSLQKIPYFFLQVEQAAGLFEECLSGTGQADSPSGAQKKLDAVEFLKFANLSRYGRLTDAQSPCGCGEATVIGDGVKGSELRVKHTENQSILSILCI